MPIVTIQLARRDVPTTREQKQQLITGVTQLLHDVLAKRPQDVTVLITEIDPDNWAQGGEMTSTARARRA